jgi:hypothetical protein
MKIVPGELNVLPGRETDPKVAFWFWYRNFLAAADGN